MKKKIDTRHRGAVAIVVAALSVVLSGCASDFEESSKVLLEECAKAGGTAMTGISYGIFGPRASVSCQWKMEKKQ